MAFVSGYSHQDFVHSLFFEISALDAYVSASEKLLKTWQENQEKVDEFMKVGLVLTIHYASSSPAVFYSEHCHTF